MSFACQILASFLLIFICFTKGTLVCGSPWSPLEASLETLSWAKEVTGQLSLAVSLKTSVTVLLFIGAAPTAIIVLGKLGHDINLNIPEFQMNDTVDDIKWGKDFTKVAQYSAKKITYQRTKNYHIFKNGTLKIKRLERNDSGTYKAEIYDWEGKHILGKQFDLRILGKSLFLTFFHLNLGAI